MNLHSGRGIYCWHTRDRHPRSRLRCEACAAPWRTILARLHMQSWRRFRQVVPPRFFFSPPWCTQRMPPPSAEDSGPRATHDVKPTPQREEATRRLQEFCPVQRPCRVYSIIISFTFFLIFLNDWIAVPGFNEQWSAWFGEVTLSIIVHIYI